MNIAIYQVDAFSNQPFTGNPAAICPLTTWLDTPLMQAIAAENNVSETAFFVPVGQCYEIRWFTPTAEVELCGHATVASAWVLWNELGLNADQIVFKTRKRGELVVSQVNGLLQLSMPANPALATTADPALLKALNLPTAPLYTAECDNWLLHLPNAQHVIDLKPDFAAIQQAIGSKGVIVTAAGSEGIDFVSRYFAPGAGIDEDPVTGSAHATSAVYWAEQLGKTTLKARQVSCRGGELLCQLQESRVLVSGPAVTVMRGELSV